MLHPEDDALAKGESTEPGLLEIEPAEFEGMHEALEERVRTTPVLYFIASNDTPFVLETLSVNYKRQASGVHSRVARDGRYAVVAVLLPEWLRGIDRAVPVDWEIRPATSIPLMEVRLVVGQRVFRLGRKPNVDPPYWSSKGRIYPPMVL